MSDKYLSPLEKLMPGSFVWAYLRDSGGDSQEKSVSQQESIIREFCLQYGLVLIRIFADAAKSGGSTEKRTEFLSMIDATKSSENRPAGILVWNLARFTRDLDDADFYKSTLRKRGIIIHSLTDQIPSGTFGPVVEKLIDVANQEYRRQNSAAVKRSLRELVKAGYAPGGNVCPKGYKIETVITGAKRDGKPRTASKWIKDPELAPLVALAFKMRADGKSYREITHATKGKLYKVVNSWPTFFKNRSYLGIGKCGDEEFQDHHEPLVDSKTFDAVQAWYRLHPREGLNNPKRIAYPSLLSGLAYCAKCGAAMVFHTARKKGRAAWPFYICSKRDRQRAARECDTRRVNARQVDAKIFDTILSRIITPAYFEELIAETRLSLSDVTSIDRAIAKKRKEMKSANQAMHNLLDLIETFGQGGAAQDRYNQREAEVKRLKYELQELESKRQSLDFEITPDALALAINEWRAELTEAHTAGNVATLRALLSRFIARIELDYTTAQIFYTFPIDSFLPASHTDTYGINLSIGQKVTTLTWRQ